MAVRASTGTIDGTHGSAGLSRISPAGVRAHLAEHGALAAITTCRVAVFFLPLMFVVASWLASAGFPNYLDSTEMFQSYVHARNLEIWDPWQYGWLTAAATDPLLLGTERVYTHNPNAPRFLHYLLLCVGVRELPAQVLILSLAATAISTALLLGVFRHPALLVATLAVVLDFSGFLSWTVNTYRIWIFAAFFGLILSVSHRRPVWVGIATFLLFQIEYGSAAFVGVTGGALALLLHGRRATVLLVAMAIGAGLSVLLFGLQVFAYLGWDGSLDELAITYARRGSAGDAGGPGSMLLHAVQGPAMLGSMVATGTHNLLVLMVAVSGLVFGARNLLPGRAVGPERFVSALAVASAFGMVATSAVLFGYFVDGFVRTLLPISVFLIAPAAGVVAFELRRLLSRRFRVHYLGAVCSLIVLAPIAAGSASHFRPPTAVELFERLENDYRGRTIVAPNPNPAQVTPELAFAFTGGRALRTSEVAATPEDIVQFESLREPDGTLTYLCLDIVYLRWKSSPEAANTCDPAVEEMQMRGHTVVASGVGWTMMQLYREQPSTPIR